MSRTIIIGDVHGCVDELEALLRRVDLAGGDRLVFVGDLVAKGPDSQGVVALARAHGAHAVLGNHDAAVLAAHRFSRGEPPDFSFRTEHVEVATQLGPADRAYLEALPLWLSLSDLDALVVHAGVVPGRRLDAQRRADLLTMRTLTDTGEGSSRFEGTAWASRWQGPPHVYFGHDARRGLQRWSWATGLDTGCVYGGELTACVLPEGRFVSVRARQAYGTAKKVADDRQG